MDIAKTHFRYTIWFMIFEKKYRNVHFYSCCTRGTKSLKKVHKKNCSPEFLIFSAVKLPSCELLVFIDMNTFILIEGTNLWTFLKKNYGIALDSYYMFTKKMLNMEFNMMLIVLVEFAYIVNGFTLTPPIPVMAKIR